MEPFKPFERQVLESSPSAIRRLQGEWFFQTKPSSAKTLPHVLFTPMHYESGYAYPLVIWLHGPGTDERQLTRIMPKISLRNYVAIGVRGILRQRIPRADGTCIARYGWPQTPEGIGEARERVVQAIEIACSKRHVHRGRIFLAGSRSGGTMAFRIGLQEPGLFAGVISLGGPLPKGGTFLRHFSKMGHLEVFLAVTRNCPSYPASLVCEHLRLLHRAGLEGIMLREYPSGWHLTLPMLRDVDRWLMERITQGASSPH